MKKSLIEESILFISILKWVAIATGIGIIVGLSTALFLTLLNRRIAFSAGYPLSESSPVREPRLLRSIRPIS